VSTRRDASFVLPTLVGVYGGFDGTEQTRAQRDWLVNETILSGDLDGDDGDDFANTAENSYHVVVGNDLTGVILDGFVIRGGNADEESDEFGGGLAIVGGEIQIASCRFAANRASIGGGGLWAQSADVTVVDCVFVDNAGQELTSAGPQDHVAIRRAILTGSAVGGVLASVVIANPGGGGIGTSGGNLIMIDCTVARNIANIGGGLRVLEGGTLTMDRCAFNDNVAAVGGGASPRAVTVTVTDCSFVGNVGIAGGGGLFQGDDSGGNSIRFERCMFVANDGGSSSGGLNTSADSVDVVSCVFAENTSGFAAGGWGHTLGVAVAVNCVFSRNAAAHGGGYFTNRASTLVNCTFSRNEGNGVMLGPFPQGEQTLENCVLWGNTPAQIGSEFDSVTFCDVEGGWPGIGNIDADPLFVQAGADDLRLAFGSPCVDAGDDDAVPTEVETDLAGGPRFLGRSVDMGAYEGEHEPMPAAAMAHDLDGGDFAILVPDGVGFDPLQFPTMVIQNRSENDDATATVTQHESALHPEARGFGEIGSILAFETSLADGDFFATMYLPFGRRDLQGQAPLPLDLTRFDAGTGNWALAVNTNTEPGPGHDRTIGDRIVRLDGGAWGTTTDLGDYGVFWDPLTERGFAWANIDHVGDFGFGAPLCPPDAGQPPDGIVGALDLLLVLAAWGEGPGPFDVNNDGTVGSLDLAALLAAWGACPEP